MSAASPRIEQPLLAFFSAIWILILLDAVSAIPLGGTATFDLHLIYALAGSLGWVAGNVFLLRRPAMGPGYLAWVTYFGGPPSLVFLLCALSPVATKQAQPLVPIWATMVFAVFFGVPLSLRRR